MQGAPASKRQRTGPEILDEDAFVAAVDAIVERDFFPDLPKLRAQQEYIDAIQRNDVDKIRQLQLRSIARAQQTPRATPVPRLRAEATPQRASGATTDGPAALEALAVVPGEAASAPPVRLDDFLAAHQGEDNAAFAVLREKDERRAVARRPWLALTAAENEGRRTAALEGGGASRHLLTWKYDPKNPLFYSPEAPMTAEEAAERARGAQPSVAYANTRLRAAPQQQAATAAAGYSVQKMGELDPFERRRREGDAPVDLDDLNRTPVRPGEAAGSARGFLATPSPAPGDSPFTTWGRMQGTPLLLEQPDTPIDTAPGPQFRVPDAPRREQIAMQLAEKAVRSQRARTPGRHGSGGSTPATPASIRAALSSPGGALAEGSPLRRMMSPGGKSLLARADMQLRASYSSPAVRVKKEPLTPKTPRSETARSGSSIESGAPHAAPSPVTSSRSVTDDLLKL